MTPDTSFAQNDGVNIAYQVVGNNILIVGGLVLIIGGMTVIYLLHQLAVQYIFPHTEKGRLNQLAFATSVP